MRPAVKGLAVIVFAHFVGYAASHFIGCAPAHFVRPVSYGEQLADCEAKSPPGVKGWETYTPCCVDVAAKRGRDPSFCFPDADADGSTE